MRLRYGHSTQIFQNTAIHKMCIRDSRKLAAYVILGLTLEGKKEVLSIQIGENESSKYWLDVYKRQFFIQIRISF